MFIDILWNAIHILKTAIMEESPDRVRVYINDKSSDNQTHWAGWEPEESEYARGLTLPGWNIPIDIQLSMGVREKNEVHTNSHSEQFLYKRLITLKKTGNNIAVAFFAANGEKTCHHIWYGISWSI
jgi:hypothetical protein